jgi:hypothetical protein
MYTIGSEPSHMFSIMVHTQRKETKDLEYRQSSRCDYRLDTSESI